MAKTLRSKTFTASLPAEPRAAFDWIADAANLPRWYSPLSRSSSVRFIRDDRAYLLDIALNVDTVDLIIAIRVLANGDGSEIVMTLVQPRGLPDAAFIEQVRWAGSAIAALEKIQSRPLVESTPLEPESPSAVRSGKKLFVGNLPFAWTEDPLRELFAVHGTLISVAIPRLRGRGGRSRGFGFVEMSTDAEAQIAIEKLHDTLAGDRKMIVRLARAQETRSESAPAANADVPVPDAVGISQEKRPQQTRPRRGGQQGRGESRRSSRPARAPRPSSRGGPASSADRKGSDRAPRDTGISNNSGYEIYPRDSKGGFSSEPTPRSAASTPHTVEPSPYFDDPGDFENRGNRPPRPRRR